ncbi:Zinc finger protein [Thalictrum thalictroides]|uniref:Zinc finger protein n=1 Tax=Thalictrum thalictroides TaxID=46969 RepID=A0A7J6VX38_THATH|nr:Zinc finger protein [Thalictrum thalictroides]
MNFEREEESPKMPINNFHTGSTSSNSGDRRVSGSNMKEWLNLSLATNDALTVGESDSTAKTISNKIFSCNFCMRKFFSSQALGGHQNAHKRERGAVRRYQSQRMVAMMGLLPLNTPISRSLGVQAHSFIHKPSKEGPGMVARFNDSTSGFGTAWAPFTLEEAMDTMWPGSFHIDLQPSRQQTELLKLDLNLKL